MSVQKILPLARKMGEENFLGYKKYVKNVKTLKPGEYTLGVFKLKNMTIVDTINFTPKTDEKIDIDGFRNVLREIHKRYFPRAADKDTTKLVTMSYSKLSEDASETDIDTYTQDKYGKDVGRSFYKFVKKGKEVILDIKSRCEDFTLNLQVQANLKDADINRKQNLSINADPRRDLRITEKGDEVLISLKADPNEDVPKFEVEASISKAKLEDMFGGGLEQALPDLLEKSGFKF